jgi:hypothetical protein
MYTLGTAAAAAGLAKSTVLRAIKGGRLSAQRDSNGQWSIDPAEFHRVFPPMMPEQTQRETLTDAMVAQLNKVIDDLRADRDHWRTEAADWKAQAQRLLPPPTPTAATADAPPATPAAGPWRRAWRWMRASG